jgi:hypothetical protein
LFYFETIGQDSESLADKFKKGDIMNQYDYAGLYQFLHQTPEKGLRQMLVDQKTFTEVHFQLLMKIVKLSNEQGFIGHIEKSDYPKMRFGPAEEKLRDKFWQDCSSWFLQRGILSTTTKKTPVAA